MDKSKLFVPRLAEGEFEMEGVGTFKFRSLSRSEALACRKLNGDIALTERKILASALTDPVLTEAEVQKWQDAAGAGDLDPLIAAIMEKSGLVTDAMKKAMSQFPDQE